MAFHNTNWEAVPMSTGTYTIAELGNGFSASTVHEIFCSSTGTVEITAMGGGTFTWAATSGQSVKVMTAKAVVSSGTFVGFRAFLAQNSIQQNRYY